MPKLNVEKLKNIGDQLINDLLRTGELQYNIDNDHDKHFTDNEREQLKSVRYRELIAVTNSILGEILDDPKNFLETVQQRENANNSDELNTFDANGMVKETQRTTKRATKRPSSGQNKRSPNPFGRSSSNNGQLVAELVKTVQDQLDQVHITDNSYYVNDESDVEGNVFLDYDDYDYNDGRVGDSGQLTTADDNVTAQRTNIDKSRWCDNCNGNRNPPLYYGDSPEDNNRSAEQLRTYKWLLAKFRQHPFNRFRGLGDAYRYGRYRKGYCPPCIPLRRTPNRRPIDREQFHDDDYGDDTCASCVADNFRFNRNFNSSPSRQSNDWWWNVKNSNRNRTVNDNNQRVTNANRQPPSNDSTSNDRT